MKQTDRMLGNAGIDVWALFRPWAEFVVGDRKEIVLALDCTEFDADDHATLAGYLVTSHGRATPLICNCAHSYRHLTPTDDDLQQIMKYAIKAGVLDGPIDLTKLVDLQFIPASISAADITTPP